LKRVKGRDGQGPAVFLSAFGKHPGWDDHIEDIGIETDHLAALKQLLYVQGIGGTIDSGAWDNLTDSQRAEGFRHVFVCRTPRDVVAGRLWSSTDGKGRTRYPMVVCAQCVGLPLRWVVHTILPRLEALQEQCASVATAGDVIAITDQAREECRELAAGTDAGEADFVVSPRTLGQLAGRPEMGPDHQGLLRILYQIEREMSPYLRGNFAAALRNDELRPIEMRVPACGEMPGEVILQWFDFLLGQLDAGAELWTIVRLDRPWVDLFVGEPAPQQFFCFQASREALPLASEIPYTLEEEFVARSEKLIEASREGKAEQIVVEAEAPAAVRRARGETAALSEKLTSLLRSSSFRLAMIFLAVAAVLLAVLIGAMALWPPAEPPTPPPDGPGMSPADAKAWDTLCGTFYEWFGSFLGDLDADRLERWKQDEHLRKHVVPSLEGIQAGTLKLDPRQLAGVVGSIRFMGRNPPDSAKSPEVIEKTRQALAIVQDVEKQLSPQGWATLKRLKDLSVEYGDRGWLKPSSYLASVAGQVKPSADLASKVDRVIAAAAKVEALEQSWDAVEKQAEQLEKAGAGHPLLAMFRRYALVETRTEAGEGSESDLEDMAKRLRKVRACGRPLVGYVRPGWQDRLDMAMVREEPPVTVPSDANDLKGGQLFEGWLAAIQSEKYQRLGAALDPRDEAWKQAQQGTFAAISGTVRKLRDEHKDANAPALAGKLKGLREEYRAICSLSWDRRNKEKIEQEMLAFAAKATGLNEKANEILLGNIGGVAAYIESLPSTISTTSPTINRYWQERLKDITKIKALAALRAGEKKLRADLSALEGELPTDLADKGGERNWIRELTGPDGALIARREQILGKALGSLAWEDNAIARGAEFEAKWKALRGEFDRWREEAAELLAAFSAIKAALDAGASLDEKPKGSDATVGAIYARWRGRAIWKDPRLTGVFESVTKRLDALADIARLTDRGRLLREAGEAFGGRFEAARAAWRRLAALPRPWPADSREFGEEIRAHRSLAAAYALLKDADRKKQLQEELIAETRRRWEAYVEARKQPSEIEEAVESMKDYHLDPAGTGRLKPINQFRLSLYHFRRKVLGSPLADDAAAKREIRGFLAAVSRLPGGVGSKEPVAGFVAEMARITAAEDSGADLAKAGPGVSLAGVKATVADDGSHVRYAWTTGGGERHWLRFARVEPKGRKASYLCTTELPVGLFIDAVTSMKKWPDVERLLCGGSESMKSEERFGPQTWRWRRGAEGIERTELWHPLPRGYEGKEKLFYFDGAKIGKPGAKHPVQYVPPAAAVYFARMLGCRLPTPQEWARARAEQGGGGGAGPANLRDQTWKRQKDHVHGLVSGGQIGGFVDGYYPDSGVFWPKDVKTRDERQEAKALPGDDGTLWFAAVDSDKAATFHHLVGNVAELVCEAAEEMEELKVRSAADAERFFQAKADRFRVIGGSALSPPAIRPETPARLAAKEAAFGYSDVGFRLAFTAPAESLGVRLRRLLTARGYLTGPTK